MTLLQRALRYLAYAYLTYLALSFLVLLPAMNILAPRIVQEQFQRQLDSELILFNPFTLAVELRRAKLIEADGHQPIALRRLLLDISISSAWEPGIVLDAFKIRELDIHLLRHKDGRFHFDDLLRPSEGVNDESTATPAVTVRELAIDAHTLRFTDRSKSEIFTTALKDIDINTRNLTTVPERQGDGDLVLAGETGGELRWNGDMDIAAGNSAGRLSLTNIDLTPLWQYNAELTAFVLDNTRLDLNLRYDIDWSADLAFRLADGELQIRDTVLRPRDEAALPTTGVRLGLLTLEGIAVASADQRVEVQRVAITGLELEGFDDDGDVSLVQMFAGDGALEAEDTSASTAGVEEDPEDDGWQAQVGTFSLSDSAVRWRTDYVSPELITVAPLDLSISQISWPAQGPARLEAELAINGTADQGAAFRADGEFHAGDGSGDITYALKKLPLEWFNPLVNQQARTDIREGVLAVEGDVTLRDFAADTINVGADIAGLVTELHETGETAFSLGRLRVAGAQIAFPAKRLSIDTVEFLEPSGSLHIREDGTINVNGVVRSGPADEVTGDVPKSTPDSGADEDDGAWAVTIDKTQLRDGRLDFADSSLPLPFSTVIEGISADLENLDTASGQPLSVQLEGAVDGYAPVLIEGKGTPLSEERSGELRFSFRGIDIAAMSPYSGTYAGYTIDSGALSLDLAYAIAGQQLDGDNRILISQMQLGERMESDRAIDIPLKLGLALLTDAQGVIDLSIPISGDVDDPEFSLGSVIGLAIRNVFVKAVSAPFKLLASLAGSSDDLENIAFDAGTGKLNADARKNLGALADALAKRPQLQLRVVGGNDPALDGDALRRARLREEFVQAGVPAASIDARDSVFEEVLSQRYAALALPVADGELPTMDMRISALLERIEIPASALEELATARAAAAKRELVTVGGVDAARIAISYDAALNAAAVKMDLDS